MSQKKMLVTGATGKVGKYLVAGLLAEDVAVRALVRRPELAELPPEVEVVAGDITDAEAVGRAADGVDAAFLLWPYFTADAAGPVVDALVDRVRRVVYLSALNPAGVWGEVEQLLIGAGADATFLRAGGFAGNTLGWADQFRTSDVIHLPSPKAARSLIHEADIADVAALTLLTDGHTGRAYDLTGPEVLTQEDQVATIAAVLGQPMRVEEQSPEEARAALLAQGADESFATNALAYWANLVDNPEPTTTTVQTLTGNPPRTFQTWAQDHAPTFRAS
ncbi:uncharacterized protein YbjT (DUF2867 family) [Kribbella amoyensis]|uniref:Uncharacterized protein YbjT (DUF2867 family) n=1 Tax=Kribbella amoyensis TaxID=996641 RepID=A0A561BLA1_9ACTN|nr:NAD(P)H-binding protein [Kribbella amoyensis]TWD79629.1 uncharacterized protein YbjT (DUF2867 family) [Kribbella amoyensis]